MEIVAYMSVPSFDSQNKKTTAVSTKNIFFLCNNGRPPTIFFSFVTTAVSTKNIFFLCNNGRLHQQYFFPCNNGRLHQKKILLLYNSTVSEIPFGYLKLRFFILCLEQDVYCLPYPRGFLFSKHSEDINFQAAFNLALRGFQTSVLDVFVRNVRHGGSKSCAKEKAG